MQCASRGGRPSSAPRHRLTSDVFDLAGCLGLGVRQEQDASSVATDITRLLKENP
jgi:hypothetical protein